MVRQFQLRSLLAAITVIAVLLASVRVSCVAPLYWGIPAAWLAWRLVTEGLVACRSILRAAMSSWVPSVLVGAALILTACVLLLGWRPYNAETYMFLMGANLWQVFLLNFNFFPPGSFRRRVVLSAPLLALAYPLFWLTCGHEDMPRFVPGGGDYYVDFATDRHRVKLWPDLDFCKAGRNHALLRSHAPAGDDQWILKAVLGDGHVFGGGDRIDTKSVLLRPMLPSILAMLPSDDARHVVILALADRKNLARVHQGLLLTCLACAGPPAGEAEDDWWATHRKVFVSVSDPSKAAGLAFEMAKEVDRRRSDERLMMNEEAEVQLRVRLRAAWWHEHDFYDEDFATEFLRLRQDDADLVRDNGG